MVGLQHIGDPVRSLFSAARENVALLGSLPSVVSFQPCVSVVVAADRARGKTLLVGRVWYNA